MSSTQRKDIDTQRCTSLKVSNLAEDVETIDVKNLLKDYETLLDVYMPMNLHKRAHRGFAFVRFRWKAEAVACVDKLDGFMLKGQRLKVDMCVQVSSFTQDTGYITNEALDSVPQEDNAFVPGMPDSHFETLAYENRDRSDVVTLRVANLGHDDAVQDDDLRRAFEDFGELAEIYRPYDKGIHPIQPRDFAFVRYLHKSAGLDALKCMHMKWLNGREMHITIPVVPREGKFSQNETCRLPAAFTQTPGKFMEPVMVSLETL